MNENINVNPLRCYSYIGGKTKLQGQNMYVKQECEKRATLNFRTV
jgi:hypothetical protein